LLNALDVEVQARLSKGSPDDAVWMDLLAATKPHLIDTLSRLLRPRWPGNPRQSAMPVEVSFRALMLDPERTNWLSRLPWVDLVPLTDAIERAGKSLRDEDLRHDLHASCLSLDDGGERLRMSLVPPVEVMAKEVSLWATNGEPKELKHLADATFLLRGQKNKVVDVRLAASILWNLSPDTARVASRAELRIRFKGREDRLYPVEVPCGNLGSHGQVVDMFLDLGSTTTKYIVRVAEVLSKPEVKRTSKLAEEWLLPPYEKVSFLADPTGATWANWVMALLSSLRRYSAQAHRGYLRSLHLTLPQSGALAVSKLASRLGPDCSATDSLGLLDGRSIDALVSRASLEAVGRHVVVLSPEHEVLARHYLEPLKVLHQAASAYEGSYHEREEERERQKTERSNWDRKKREQQDFDNRWFGYRWLHTRPAGPKGGHPTISQSFATPADWMKRLIEHPEMLERVILLDAGGLSLDMVVLESAELVPALSMSDSHCGGEEVTKQFAQRLGVVNMSSDDGTREKARLGDLWDNPNNTTDLGLDERFRRFGGRDQRAYREVTSAVYRETVRNLALKTAASWKHNRSARCTVLLTGGGSRNPHFQDLVAESIGDARLEAEIMDARAIQDLLAKARDFKHPLPALDAPAVKRFSMVHGWALGKVQGADRMVYDKYAVVGGLLAGVDRT
jgi:hypothetical protein